MYRLRFTVEYNQVAHLPPTRVPGPINIHLLTELVIVMQIMMIQGHRTERAHLRIAMGNERAVCRINRLHRCHQLQNDEKQIQHRPFACPDWLSSILPVIREHSRLLSRG
jgi:hypothetical protein